MNFKVYRFLFTLGAQFYAAPDDSASFSIYVPASEEED